MVAVHGLGGARHDVAHGYVRNPEAPERSAVLAVLDATNRWVDARR
jgi:hypothetical protein